jgi:imidazolonepropionase
MFDTLWTDCNLATMREGGADYGAIERGAIGVKGGRIAWVGYAADAPNEARDVRRCEGAWITPGLVECHTHLVFGGDRAREFEMRLQGASYEDIARAGGGIVSTVAATRAASKQELIESAARRLAGLTREGVTTIEIKSGYGLDLETELKMLEAAGDLGSRANVRVKRTFLGLHALPPEFRDDRAAYVQLVADVMIPAIAAAGAADAVDAFCEGIGFTPAQTRRVFDVARALGLPVKLHADQLSDLGGAALAAEFGGLSADHVEYTSADSVRAMAARGTVAVLLPGAFHVLRETKLPPLQAFRDNGVAMAVATDCNPGTSPLLSLRQAMQLACSIFRLTPEEALRGATVHAARALGLPDRGVLRAGMRADFVQWSVAHPAELCYWLGGRLAQAIYVGGRAA